ncbi:MAG: hypothetical protein P1U75_12160 [Antarcticimicrobium sp.]|uniref:hypothetical protein n=1 Tax=Antarcticimicrobium sp. TaxID=2824147 RepID=UPI0026089D42|nr:hypothetical protein [Antarcticimicrobium sp.]MDF1717408.1 hypothetical protein [Antarcticimicrobium sp.]
MTSSVDDAAGRGRSEKDMSAKKDAKPSDEKPDARRQSRMERLKKKVRKLQGKNPDIYPMW